MSHWGIGGVKGGWWRGRVVVVSRVVEGVGRPRKAAGGGAGRG